MRKDPILSLYRYKTYFYNNLKFLKGSQLGLNPYLYVVNNPINLIDPFGLAEFDIGAGAEEAVKQLLDPYGSANYDEIAIGALITAIWSEMIQAAAEGDWEKYDRLEKLLRELIETVNKIKKIKLICKICSTPQTPSIN